MDGAGGRRRPDVTTTDVIGGPEPVAVTLHEPDPRWAEVFRDHARDVHVHVYEHGDPAVAAYRLLRDHLRVDAADRELYARTKRELLDRRWDDMNDYADAKTEVIEAIKARARHAV